MLWREFQEVEEFGVVFEVAEGVVNDLFAGRAKLGELSRVGGESMAELGGHATSSGEGFGGERCESVAVFGVAGEGKHLAAEAHEFDTVAIVPAKHFYDVAGIG